MKRFLSATAAALALLLMTGMGVHASPLDPSALAWSYTFTPVATSLAADGQTGASLVLSNVSATPTGNTDVVGTYLKLANNAQGALTGANGDYSLKLVVSYTDEHGVVQSNLSAPPTLFTGHLSGSFSAGNSIALTNTFTNAPQSVQVGTYIFAVSLSTFVDASSDPTVPGAIGGTATITAAPSTTGGGGTASTPEPGTMVLAGLGMTFFGGAAWRKRRQARVAVAS